MNKKRKIILISLVFIVYSIILVRVTSSSTIQNTFKSNDTNLTRFVENYNNLKENWYYFSDEKKVLQAANDAMTNSNLENDKYSMYIQSDQSAEYFEQMDSEYVGIGIQYLMSAHYPIVSKVFNNSPAALSKVMVGDNIISVDNKNIKDIKADDLKKLVAGKKDTKVMIEVLRNNKKVKINLVRKPIEASVHYEIKNNKGYLAIDEFSKTTTNEVEKALKYFQTKKVKKVIIDVRNNPGGYLDSLEGIADLFLKKDKIVLITKDKKNNVSEYRTKDDKAYENNYIILINNNSASASEALVASLNENLDIPLYGETTFGKGIMQTFKEYSDGSYLKYTSAEWFTPKNKSINKKGVAPTKKINKSAVFEAVNLGYSFEKDLKFDSVSTDLISYQKALKALGYPIDRIDGYYSIKTKNVVEKFKKDNKLTSEKDLSKVVASKIIEKLFIATSLEKNDLVLKSALS